jgi:hypothetical protein
LSHSSASSFMDMNNSWSSTLVLDTSLIGLLLYSHLVCGTDGKRLLTTSSRALALLEGLEKKQEANPETVLKNTLHSFTCSTDCFNTKFSLGAEQCTKMTVYNSSAWQKKC